MSEADDTFELNKIQQRLIRVSSDRETIVTKAQVMAEFDSGERKLESGTIDDVHVRLFGDVAVVSGRTAATGSYQGNSVSVKLRFTDVFVKRNGTWYAVASHATLINP